MRLETAVKIPTSTTFIMFAQVRGTHSLIIGLGRPDKLSTLSVPKVPRQSDLRAKMTMSAFDQLVGTVEDFRGSPAGGLTGKVSNQAGHNSREMGAVRILEA